MLETPITADRNRVLGSVFSSTAPGRSPLSPSALTLGLATLNPPPTAADYPDPVRYSSGSSDTTEYLNDDPFPDEAAWNRAWSVATAFLAIPDCGFDPLLVAEELSETGFLKQWDRHQTPSKDASDALALVLGPLLRGEKPRLDRGQGDILAWYESEMRRHFLKNFKDGLLKLWKDTVPTEVLYRIVHCLQLARHIYFVSLENHILPLLIALRQGGVLARLQRSFQMMASYVLAWPELSALIYHEIAKEAIIVLGIDAVNEGMNAAGEDSMDLDRSCPTSYQSWREQQPAEVRMQMMTVNEDVRAATARESLLTLIRRLELVGLGGNKVQKVFASVMNAMMTEFVRLAYTRQWEAPTLAPQHLRHWVLNVFAPLISQVLAEINTSEPSVESLDKPGVSLVDVEKWQEIGISRLGMLRTSELFDVIVEWPASSGAIEDLRHFTMHPAARYYLTHSFINTLNSRLLHPGASTSEILQLYISIIRAFNILDPRAVLLDRIARPIRRYLRDRDDTVKVIVSGLFADPAEAHSQASSGEILIELSSELANAHQRVLQSSMGELDWDDMNWTPDPVDAAPDYRKPGSSDVIGSVISLFETKETFVREIQNTLAERLLQNREDFDQEVSVLELLKLRFGDGVLQACEVMLRDIFDSRQVDDAIQQDQRRQRRRTSPIKRGRSPKTRGQGFKAPGDILELQQRYAAGFESLKQSRKLTWLNGLGQATVELDLEDRVFVDEVTTWQAAVIYVFQSPSNGTVKKTITQLSGELEMTPSLVRSACLFWVSKRILIEVERETFSVLESLPQGESDPSAASAGTFAEYAGDISEAADAAAAAAAKESADATAMEKMNLYWQYIVGMLTNQGAMPLQQIVMMLKIAVPGGFPFSNEELRNFLVGMVSRGKLEIVSGGSYKIVQ